MRMAYRTNLVLNAMYARRHLENLYSKINQAFQIDYVLDILGLKPLRSFQLEVFIIFLLYFF